MLQPSMIQDPYLHSDHRLRLVRNVIDKHGDFCDYEFVDGHDTESFV
jgi:hypothetical protein